MVERQVLAGLRSTHGEFCPGTVQLQEWLVGQYRARLRLEGERDDGMGEDELTTAFRCELRAALLVATAKGTAQMLAVAGRPFHKGDAQRIGAWPGARAAADLSARLPRSSPQRSAALQTQGTHSSARLANVRCPPPSARVLH